MAEINSDADVDTLIWSTLQGSTCAQDYLDFIRHASGRVCRVVMVLLID